MDVSIIIVNYNTKQLLADCLHSVFAQTKDISFEVIVSDNGSTDGSIEMLKNDFPKVVLIENNANLGFGKANNGGAKVAKGKYLFFLNSDTLLLNNAIKAFFDFAESKNETCILGAWLLDAEQSVIQSYGCFTSFCKQLFQLLYEFFPFFLKIRLRLYPLKKDVACDEVFPVDFVTGADLFMPTSVFEIIRGFDENFFMYYEDNDLCRRAKQKNCKALLISAPQIVHLVGKSSKSSARRIAIIEKSFLYYTKKYTSKAKFSFYIFLYRLFAFIRLLSFDYSFGEKKELISTTRKNISNLSVN